MDDKRVYLKVKLKSLAAEARIIRQEEARNKHMRLGLMAHRRDVVRPEARATHLAYSFLRGKRYADIERHVRTDPDWGKIQKMVERYGTFDWKAKPAEAERFQEWKKTASVLP